MTDIFITDNFLLQCDEAVRLYHEFARDLPTIIVICRRNRLPTIIALPR